MGILVFTHSETTLNGKRNYNKSLSLKGFFFWLSFYNIYGIEMQLI